MKTKLYFILSMIIFGTIGLFVKQINFASSQIALFRGLVGSVLLLLLFLYMEKKKNTNKMQQAMNKKNAIFLVLSSIALGANWIFLFESFKHTTVSNATLSYYFAPVLVALLSPVILKEKLSSKKIICIGFAMLGMIFIVGSNKTSQPGYHHLLGIADGLIAASFYATLMLLNKFIKNMDGLKTTLIQLSMATILLIPYVVITSPIKSEQFTKYSIFLILIVGFLHTGIAFSLFFTGMKGLKGQSIAILSYIDPITSLLLSFFILQERMTLLQVTGAIMLLGATLLSESKVKLNKSISE